jgi:ribonuclease Z
MAKCDFRFHRFLTSPKTTPRAAPTFLVKPALGYRIDFAGHSVVLSGDTRFSNNLVQFSQKADLLIHEVIDPDGFRKKNPSISPERFQAIVGHHTTAQQAGTVFARVKPKLAVYSHIVPGDSTEFSTATPDFVS